MSTGLVADLQMRGAISAVVNAFGWGCTAEVPVAIMLKGVTLVTKPSW